MTCGVVVLDYDQMETTIRCLRSVVETEVRPETVVLVENGDSKLPEKEREEFQQKINLVVLRPGQNLGCAGGRNLGLAYLADNTDVSTYITLDNDTLVPSDFFSQVKKLDVGSLTVYAPVINNLDGSLWCGGVIQADGTPEINRSIPEADGNYAPVDWAPGACLIFARETWDKVGEFDVWMNFYFEDTDWCMRVQSAGGCVHLDPELRLKHEKHSSLDEKGEARRTRFWARNGTVFRADSMNGDVSILSIWGADQMQALFADLTDKNFQTAVARANGLLEGINEALSRL